MDSKQERNQAEPLVQDNHITDDVRAKGQHSTYVRSNRTRIGNLADCPPLLQRYINAKQRDGLSVRTLNQYYEDVRLFLRFIRIRKEGLSPSDYANIPIQKMDEGLIVGISQEDADSYIRFLVLRKDSEARISMKISAVRSFYRYLEKEKETENPFKRITVSRRVRMRSRSLSRSEASALLCSAASHSQNPERDVCLTTFALYMGLRVSELRAANVSDVKELPDGTGWVLRLAGSKRKEERKLFLNRACLDALTAWLPVRAACPRLEPRERALFISRRSGFRLTDRRIQKIIERQLIVAGLEDQGYNLQSLRDTAAAAFLEGGSGLDGLARIMGIDIQAARRYADDYGDKTREVLENMRF